MHIFLFQSIVNMHNVRIAHFLMNFPAQHLSLLCSIWRSKPTKIFEARSVVCKKKVVKQSGSSDSPSSWHIVHTWTARAQFVWGLWLTHPLCYLWWAKKSLVGEEVHSGGNTPRCGVQRVKRHEIMFSSGKCNQCEYDSSPSDDLRKHMASAQSTWQQFPPTQIHLLSHSDSDRL